MTQTPQKRNRFLPWYIGLIIILASVIFVGFQMSATSCPAPAAIEIGLLTIVPIVYLVLMYLTFKSQE